MTSVALAVPAEDARRLTESAAHHGHDVVASASTGDELADRIIALVPDLVIVAAQPPLLTARLIEVCDRIGVRIRAVATAGQEQYARELGFLDTSPSPFEWEQLEPRSDARPPVAAPHTDNDPSPAVSALPRRRRATTVADARAETSANDQNSWPAVLEGRPARSRRVIVVWGPGGSPGRTTLAISIAAELALAGHRVALADADTHSAGIAPALGLLDEAPGFAAACRLAGSGALDGAEFDRVAQMYGPPGGRFAVLTGLGRPSRWPELSTERVRATLAAARDWAEFTVVDVASSIEHDEEISSDIIAPRRNAATVAALFAADQVIAVGAGDPVGISRFVRAHGELLDSIAPPDVTVVMNKVRASAVGLNAASQVRQTLQRFGGIDEAVLVPHDLAALDAAVLTGRALAESAPRAPVRTAIRDLVATHIAPPEIAPDARPARMRLRLARGRLA